MIYARGGPSPMAAEIEAEERGWVEHLEALSPFDRAVKTYPAALPVQARVDCPKCEAVVGSFCHEGLELIHSERVAAVVLQETPHLEGATTSWWTRHLRENNSSEVS